ncbi:4a-hydroxytetrahydrobiopterin dehydratase [Mesorhizobium sp. Z1-4]|uniref:4a-hydroxytetrahydrobiopterin dehydratase n=1 Tax=Mesorhizobium sp. Z1-4 TaxID=2448478 RepID=UPI000FD94D05|nr:4a-hydroxytetrahydrobiopterin dehydratase [Mesorhizobium sp. Z1-4]
MAPRRFEEAEIRQGMKDLPDWNLAGDLRSISRRFTFADFNRAFGFMTQVAMEAEKLNHHPEWANVYKTVDVKLNTHDVDGLSELDFKLALMMDKLAGSR